MTEFDDDAAVDSMNRPLKGDKRVRIVDAAVGVFAEKGYHSARISDIARQAGVADGTIYLYFRNKEDLLLTIFEEKMDGILQGLQAALTGVEGPQERMRVFARFHFEQMRQQPALAQVLQVELRQSSRFVREYRPERLWDYLAVFSGIVELGQSTGAFRADIDPFLVKWAFFGALDELSIQWVVSRNRERFNLEKAAEQVVDVFLQGMGGTPSVPPT